MKHTLAVRWLLAAMIVVGLMGWAISGQPAYARLFYVGLIILAGSGMWAALSLRGINLDRQARVLRASVGDIYEEHFEISNTARYTCYLLEIKDESLLPHSSGSRLLTTVGGRQKRSYVARTWLSRRGAFTLGPTVIASGDPFGLFSVHRSVPNRNTLIVLPLTVDIPDFPAPPGILPGGKAIRQKTQIVTPHAAGIREYLPGDPMKRIHWPSTARRSRFMVKEFEQDPQAEIWIFLDAESRVHVTQPFQGIEYRGEGWWLQRRLRVTLPQDTFEYTVSIAGSVARYFLQERKVVGLACAGARLTIMPGERGERQISKILETLAFLQPDGDLSILGLVTMQAKLLPVGSGVILVTPSASQDVVSAVEDLQRRNLRPMVALLDSESFGGQSNAVIAQWLLERNIPVCHIFYGQNLADQLVQFAAFFRRPAMPNPSAVVY